MNKLKVITLLINFFFVFFAFACEKKYEVDEPSACFSICNSRYEEVTAARVGEELIFKPCNYAKNADMFVVWSGDEDHCYSAYVDSLNSLSNKEKYISKDQGAVVSSEAGYSYSYKEPGVYTVTWIATNNNGFGDNTRHSQLQKEIVITE